MADSFSKDKIKVLLLEGIDKSAERFFQEQGYTNVKTLSHAPGPAELAELLKDVYILGIRSKTAITKEVLARAKKLFTLGCFCIGTNQVDLEACKTHGIPVFNAPHANTRSVAELVIGLAVMLQRNIFPLSVFAHQGIWKKKSEGSYELRGKTLGIIGYGNIGSQVSVLAESFGMRVIFYDTKNVMPLGNAKACSSLKQLAKEADIITLHVPETPETENMLDIEEMKEGSCLLNTSRGKVVDLHALSEALAKGKIKGAAIDVFPDEPESENTPFTSPLQGDPRVILTPHIGGSTQEAQKSIAKEVAQKLVYFSDRGSTQGAVNFPELSLMAQSGSHRVLHIHQNISGMLRQINEKIAEKNINILGQYLLTREDIGYVVLDLETKVTRELMRELAGISGTIRTRLLY